MHIVCDGAALPPPLTSFAAMRLPAATLATLEAEGIATPTPIQAQALPVLLAGRDCVGISSTGSGKTIAFVLPMLMHALQVRRRALAGTHAAGLTGLQQQMYVAQQLPNPPTMHDKPLRARMCYADHALSAALCITATGITCRHPRLCQSHLTYTHLSSIVECHSSAPLLCIDTESQIPRLLCSCAGAYATT